jgi:hypothetical protein
MRRAVAAVALGAVLGIAWSASLRGYMAQVAGPESRVTWLGTFAAVILPGAVVGALLGRASHRRGTGPVWLACSPLLLAVAPLALARCGHHAGHHRPGHCRDRHRGPGPAG